jgi:hypothetical protein
MFYLHANSLLNKIQLRFIPLFMTLNSFGGIKNVVFDRDISFFRALKGLSNFWRRLRIFLTDVRIYAALFSIYKIVNCHKSSEILNIDRNVRNKFLRIDLIKIDRTRSISVFFLKPDVWPGPGFLKTARADRVPTLLSTVFEMSLLAK